MSLLSSRGMALLDLTDGSLCMGQLRHCFTSQREKIDAGAACPGHIPCPPCLTNALSNEH